MANKIPRPGLQGGVFIFLWETVALFCNRINENCYVLSGVGQWSFVRPAHRLTVGAFAMFNGPMP